jgi:hypothetical protein
MVLKLPTRRNTLKVSFGLTTVALKAMNLWAARRIL